MNQNKLNTFLQHIAPQHALTALAGWLSECRWKWVKNAEIKYFIWRFDVNINDAQLTSIDDYPTFNSFFTRQLKPELRPITQETNAIVCPADGCISQIGNIRGDQLFQAKGFDFSLRDLVGGSESLAKEFHNGNYATIYLSPKDYHRVHMPLTGKLREAIYIPGKLFSVSQQTVQAVQQLFSRNERLVCIFDTELGPMAVILVGAMLVGSINTVWGGPLPTKEIFRQIYPETGKPEVQLERGSEMGHFKMGSTVIILFPEKKISWGTDFQENSHVRMGQSLGEISQP